MQRIRTLKRNNISSISLIFLALGIITRPSQADDTPPAAKKAVWGTGPQAESYKAEDPSDEAETSPKKKNQRKTKTDPHPQDFQIAFGLNYLFAAQSKNKVTGSGLNLPITTGKDETSVNYSVEGTHHPILSTWGVSLIIENGKYAYRNTMRVSDSHMGIWIAPRIQGTWDHFSLWGSLGLGLMKSTFNASNYSEGSINYALSASEGSTYSYTIRLGLDYYMTRTQDWFVGPQLSYTEFTAKNTGIVTQGSVSAPYENQLVRSWINFGIKLGLYF